jgi:hypothetical protein
MQATSPVKLTHFAGAAPKKIDWNMHEIAFIPHAINAKGCV